MSASSDSASLAAGPDYAGCLEHLSANFSFSTQSVRTSVVGERAGYFNLGAMFGSGKVGLTHLTHVFHFSCICLNQFLLACFPQEEWTSICVARSVQMRVHSDSGNLPGSQNFSVSLGEFTGGELWLAGGGSVPRRDVFGRVKYGHTVCTRHSPFLFSCETLHAAMPWNGGPRWALTAYSVPCVEVMSAAARSQLVELGFPLPGIKGASSAESPQLRPLGTSFSLNPGLWQSLAKVLDDSMHFVSSPAGSGIPVGGKLLSAKHVELHRNSDLRLVQPSGKRVWLRIADPRTEKRKLSDTSKEFVKFWMRWAICSPRLRALRPLPTATPVLVAADAMASGSQIGIGGFAMLHKDSPLVWFSERFEVQEFKT
eukprot:s9319_g1.t1